MRYKIGDVSRILGISTDLLRYYEKKGVVKPDKDKTNGYRYYDAWDMNFLIDCIWYKNFGFGIDQIADMGSNYSYMNLLEVLDGKRLELGEIIEHNILLAERLNEHLERMTGLKDEIGECGICESPAVVCYLNRHSHQYDNREESWRLSREWLRYMPFMKRYFEISQESIRGASDEAAWGFSLDKCYADRFKVTVKAPVTYFPPTLSIHSAFKSAGKNAFSARHLDYIVNYANENGYEVIGGARGNLICSVFEDDKITGYFEVWIPVAGKNS